MLNLQKWIVVGSRGKAFGSRGAIRINRWIIDMLPPPCLDRHSGTHTPIVTYGSWSLLCAGQLTQSKVLCLYLLLQSFIFRHKCTVELMFAAGKKKPPFNAVCSWLFHESPKRFNLPLPQLKLPPSHWSKGGLKHSPTIPCTAIWPIIVQLLSRWGRVWWWRRCRFPFLMSAVRFQVCGFLSCRARTIWSHIGVSFSAFDSAVSLLEKDIIFSQITANHLDLLTQACLFYWLLNWATALFCLI